MGKYDPPVKKKPKILVAPLDWGLGHATRCIPIINRLLERNMEVIILSGKGLGRLLKDEFPSCRVIDFPGYGIRYGKTRRGTMARIFGQIPRMGAAIRRERKWLEGFIRDEGLDGIISDNRYGLYYKGLFTVFMTHQLGPRIAGMRPLEKIALQLHARYIRRFSVCWVPDQVENDGWSGILGHPEHGVPARLRYIGPLSRFRKLDLPENGSLLVVVSGPEPQRSLFENRIAETLASWPGKKILVRGLPGDNLPLTGLPGFEVHNHLDTAELNRLYCQAALVVGRCGYSTVMDVLSLGKRSLLVPTPGQSEQEYLSRYLQEKKLIYSVPQENFGLHSCKEALENFCYTLHTLPDEDPLDKALNECLGHWKFAIPS